MELPPCVIAKSPAPEVAQASYRYWGESFIMHPEAPGGIVPSAAARVTFEDCR